MYASDINNHVSGGSLEQHGKLIYLKNLPLLAMKVWIAEHSFVFVVLSFELTWIIAHFEKYKQSLQGVTQLTRDVDPMLG